MLFQKMCEQNAVKCFVGYLLKKEEHFTKVNWVNSLTVLFENENKEGYIHGFTENYVKVKSPWNPALVNTLHPIKLTRDR